MALNFAGITKKRVQFVPNVHNDEIPIKSGGSEIMTTGHDIIVPVSVTSNPPIIGQAGQERTHPALEDNKPVTNCNIDVLYGIGQTGHVGHAVLDKNTEYFEKAIVATEHDNNLPRVDTGKMLPTLDISDLGANGLKYCETFARVYQKFISYEIAAGHPLEEATQRASAEWWALWRQQKS